MRRGVCWAAWWSLLQRIPLGGELKTQTISSIEGRDGTPPEDPSGGLVQGKLRTNPCSPRCSGVSLVSAGGVGSMQRDMGG